MGKRSSKNPAKPRPLNGLKHPRALNAKHGFKMVEQLFDKLTPEGWQAPTPPNTDS